MPNIRLCGPLVVALWLRVIWVDELTAEIVAPTGMPVPPTDWPTFRVFAPMNVRFAMLLLAVALLASVMLADVGIAELFVPPGMPVPVTDWPTNRLVVVDSPVTDFDPLVSVPVKRVDNPVTDAEPL